MQGDVVSAVLLPLILAFIMGSLGLGLTTGDFRRIAAEPRAFAWGLVCHFIVLPATCFALMNIFSVPGPLAVGFMLLAACPTGTASNMLTYIARGDVALALSFTAVASVATTLTVPVILSLSMQAFLGEAQHVDLPMASLMAQVFAMVGLPVAVGMLIRAKQPPLALRVEPIATKIATVLFVIIVVVAVQKNWIVFREHFAALAPIALLLNVAMLGVGLLVGRLGRFSRQQAVTIAIETAIQNASLAIVIGSTVLKQDVLSIPGAIYGVLMYVGGLAFAFGMRYYARRRCVPA